MRIAFSSLWYRNWCVSLTTFLYLVHRPQYHISYLPIPIITTCLLFNESDLRLQLSSNDPEGCYALHRELFLGHYAFHHRTQLEDAMILRSTAPAFVRHPLVLAVLFVRINRH